MTLDNTDLKVDAKTISFAVEQKIVISIKHHSHVTNRNLVTHTIAGPKAG
jgi:hypothetical protein